MAKAISGRLLQRGMFEDLYVSYCWATRCRNCGGHIRDTVVYQDKIDGTYSHVVCDDSKHGRRVFARHTEAQQTRRQQLTSSQCPLGHGIPLLAERVSCFVEACLP